MQKIIKSLVLPLTLISSNLFATSYVTSTPSKIVLNESVTIDWSSYYVNRYPNQTYNLYVYKPAGMPKLKYRSGLTATSDVRGPNTISGTQTIQVEVCDQFGENCITNSRGRVRVHVDHQCEYRKRYSYLTSYAYFCDGNKVTQSVEANNNPLGGIDRISDFVSIKDRLYWKFTERKSHSSTSHAWYTSCRSGGEIERVTEYITNTSFPGFPSSFSRIDNFVPIHNYGQAEWTYYNGSSKTYHPRTAYFHKC